MPSLNLRVSLAIRRIFQLGVTAYVVALAYFYGFQQNHIFNFASGHYGGAYDLPQGSETFWLDRPDGARIEGARFPSLTEAREPLVFFRGNAGNIEDAARVGRVFTDMGFDVYTIDYRGFGQSTGAVSELPMLADAVALYDYVANETGLEDVKIVGYSLGTTFATHVASERAVSELVLLAPMKSVLDMGIRRYPFLPEFISRFPLRSDLKLDRVAGRVQIFHGRQDRIVPLASGIELKPLLGDDDRFVIYDDAHHLNLPYLPDLTNYLRDSWRLPKRLEQAR